MFLTVYYKIKLSFIQLRWYFCRGKEVDFASVLQVRPWKTFVRKIRTTADKSITARNRTITSNESWNKNGSKSTNITTYKPWPFVLFEMNICCLRGLLRWLTEQINLNPFEVWKRGTYNLPVILYETMSWLPAGGLHTDKEGLNGVNR